MAVDDFGLNDQLFARLNDSRICRHMKFTFGRDGLSEEAIIDIEGQLGFSMPPDFRYYLANTSEPAHADGFSWRNFEKTKYDERVKHLLDGVLFDLENSALWLKRWGQRPNSREDAINRVVEDFQSWPKLLPFWGGYLPASPCEAGNPVFSIHQTDIIYVGANILDRLINLYLEDKSVTSISIKQIPIWSDFAECRDGIFQSSAHEEIDDGPS